jgi:hypothetical protein
MVPRYVLQLLFVEKAQNSLNLKTNKAKEKISTDL